MAKTSQRADTSLSGWLPGIPIADTSCFILQSSGGFGFGQTQCACCSPRGVCWESAVPWPQPQHLHTEALTPAYPL